MIDGIIKHFFACPITDEDVAVYDMPRGTADGQQLWECLAILVAVDIWSSLWLQNRIILKVKADNVGALTLLIKMRPGSSKDRNRNSRRGATLGGIALSAGRFAHAGSRTYYADRLSRVYAPGVDSKQPGKWNGAAASCHVALAAANQTPSPTRERGW